MALGEMLVYSDNKLTSQQGLSAGYFLTLYTNTNGEFRRGGQFFEVKYLTLLFQLLSYCRGGRRSSLFTFLV